MRGLIFHLREQYIYILLIYVFEVFNWVNEEAKRIFFFFFGEYCV